MLTHSATTARFVGEIFDALIFLEFDPLDDLAHGPSAEQVIENVNILQTETDTTLKFEYFQEKRNPIFFLLIWFCIIFPHFLLEFALDSNL